MNLTEFGSDSQALLAHLDATYPLPNGARYLWKVSKQGEELPGFPGTIIPTSGAMYIGSLGYMRGSRYMPLMQSGGDTPDEALFYVERAYTGQEFSTQVFLIKREGDIFTFFLGRVPLPVKEAYEKAVATGDTVTASIIRAKIQAVVDRGAFTGNEDWSLPQPQIVSPIKEIPSIVSTVNDADAAAAVRQIEGFLKTNYALPPGWMYSVKPFVTVRQNTQTGQNVSFCTVRADAVYVGGAAPRDSVSAGEVTVSSDVYPQPWQRCGTQFQLDAAPYYQLTVQNVFREDARALPQQQVIGSVDSAPLAALPIELIHVVGPPIPDPGVGSTGQAPWDEQPDVTGPVLVPKVEGADYGVGFTPTHTQKITDPRFLDWLNLTVPDAREVREILQSGKDLDEYWTQYQKILQAPAPVIGGVSVPAFMPPELYDKPLRPVFEGDNWEGDGTLPQLPAPGDYTQQPPVNIEVATLTATQVDNVGLMLDYRGSDFLNMLAAEYSGTIQKVSAIPKARQDLNGIIDSGNMGAVENFLRNFDASSYAAKEEVKPEKPATVAALISPVWLVLGLVGFFWLVTSGKVKA